MDTMNDADVRGEVRIAPNGMMPPIGRLMLGAMAATAVACIIAMYANRPESWAAHKAFQCFSIGLSAIAPFLLLAHEQKAGRYDVSRLMKWIPVLGFIACVVGLALFIGSVDEATGWAAFLIGAGANFALMKAEDRARILRASSNKK
jgi:ABC-type Na+ efflux pump permease subunit